MAMDEAIDQKSVLSHPPDADGEILVLRDHERLARDREDLAHFNAEVIRYNLMMSYPDGLDEESVVRTKPFSPPRPAGPS